MAEIQVQTKKQNTSTAWVWIILVLAVVVAIAFFLTKNNSAEDGVPRNTTAGYIINAPLETWEV